MYQYIYIYINYTEKKNEYTCLDIYSIVYRTNTIMFHTV